MKPGDKIYFNARCLGFTGTYYKYRKGVVIGRLTSGAYLIRKRWSRELYTVRDYEVVQMRGTE